MYKIINGTKVMQREVCASCGHSPRIITEPIKLAGSSGWFAVSHICKSRKCKMYGKYLSWYTKTLTCRAILRHARRTHV